MLKLRQVRKDPPQREVQRTSRGRRPDRRIDTLLARLLGPLGRIEILIERRGVLSHRPRSSRRSIGERARAAAIARSARVDAAYRRTMSRLRQPATAMRSPSFIPAANIACA